MSRFLASALGAAVLLALAVTIAFAGTPDPNQSFGEIRLGFSPKNLTVDPTAQYEYIFTLNESNGSPVEGFPASQVVLDFSSCFEPSTRPAQQIPADGPSNANGELSWKVNLTFGGGDPCSATVLVQNQLFATLDPHGGPEPCQSVGTGCGGLRSPDENGDGLVALGDLSTFQQAFVANFPQYQGDLSEPFDDITALGDLSAFQKHFIAP